MTVTGVLERIQADVLTPMFDELLPAFDSPKARVMLLAITLQEAKGIHRIQQTNSGAPGPARGLWQFERHGGVKGVLQHRASRMYALDVCSHVGVAPTPMTVWNRLAVDDVLAAAFARLLLWTDPQALPRIGDAEGAWDYYIRNWRPGKPHPRTWPGYYAQAVSHE